MTSRQVQNVQYSDWSSTPAKTFPRQQFFHEKNQTQIQSNIIHSVNANQSFSKNQIKKKNHRQWWSSISSFVPGILFGVLAGCIILAVILPLWLVKGSTSEVTITPNVVLRWNKNGITVAGNGTTNNTSSILMGPYGFTLDSSKTLYIAEYHGHRVTKWTVGASTSVIIAGSLNGTLGNGTNEFYHPLDVLVESNGDMYVTDRYNHRLQYWRNGATSATTIASSLYGAAGIVRDPNSNVLYIACPSSHSIVSYPSNSVVAGGNGNGISQTQLLTPFGFVFDSISRSFIITSHQGHSIVRWPLNATNWTLVSGTPGFAGSTASLLNGPVGITQDLMGNLYVADSNNHRVQFFADDNSEGLTIAGISGTFGSNSTHLRSPYWVKLDNQLNLYVSDISNNRIQKFLRY